MKHRVPIFSSLVAANCFFGLASADQNLLPNGDFRLQEQVAGWTVGDGSIVWSSDDQNSNSSSGSLLLSTSMTSRALSGSALSSCFAVSAGSAYTIGGASRIENGGATGSMNCSTYSDAACSTDRTHLTISTFAGNANWTAASEATGVLPSNANSASCLINLFGTGTAQSSAMQFDNLFFNSTARVVPVRLQEFRVD